MNGLLRNIERILRNRRTRRMLQRTISMFAAIVVFFTTYALVLPAITMEKNAGCGIEEHQHDDSCYEDQLICGLEETEEHQHTADCYERVLVCGKEAHTHSAACYSAETYVEVDAGTDDNSDNTDDADTSVGTTNGGEITVPISDPSDGYGQASDGQPTDGLVTEDPAALTTDSTAAAYPAVIFDDAINVRSAGLTTDTEVGTDSGLQTVLDETSLFVHVEADEETFPEGTTMVLSEVTDDTIETVATAVEGALSAQDAAVNAQQAKDASQAQTRTRGFHALDISFYDLKGNKIEPLRPVRVSITSDAIRTAVQDETTVPVVVHVEDQTAQTAVSGNTSSDNRSGEDTAAATAGIENAGTETAGAGTGAALNSTVVEAAETTEAAATGRQDLPADAEQTLDTLTFEAGAFSVYAIVYTVDFHWEVDGKNYDFSIPGGGYVSLYDLVKDLSITEDKSDTEKDEIQELVDGVETIAFSNPDLVSVSRTEENTTVGAIKDGLGLECEYSADLTEKQIAEINAQEVLAGDWALISLKPFDTEESMTVTMINGETWTVKVTDAQIRTLYLSDSGELYEVTVTYGADAQIPDGSRLEVTEYDNTSEEYQAAWDSVMGNSEIMFTEKALQKEAETVEEESEFIVPGENKEDVSETDENIYFQAFDVTILDSDGNEVEPKAPVHVVITLQYAASEEERQSILDTLEVHHLSEKNNETVAETVLPVSGTGENREIAVNDETVRMGFETSSFSVYTISWNTGNGTITVRFNYKDENGNVVNGMTGSTSINHISGDRDYVMADYAPVVNGYEFKEASYQGTVFTTLRLTPNTTWYYSNGWKNGGYSYNRVFFLNSAGIPTYTETYTRNQSYTVNIDVVYRKRKQRKVHYGYIENGQFIEWEDELIEDIGTPGFMGDQFNVRKDFSGKDYVTTRLNNPVSGVEISPLLQTEADGAAYWKYRVLDTISVNAGINEWQIFDDNDQDLYVIYRNTPTNSTDISEGDSTGDLDAPVTDKSYKSNGDGTYDISLSAMGSSKQSRMKTHANVVIVLDTSTSMFDPNKSFDTGEAGKNRLTVAKEAVLALAQKLFGYNTSEDPDAIDVAFVNFAHRVRNEQDMNTIYDTYSAFENYFNTNVYEYEGYGGTNYDTALEAANSILWDDADPVYIVFITDGDTVSRGYMKYDNNGDGSDYASDWDSGTYYKGTEATAARARSAAKLQVDMILASGKKFYSIGVFGTVSHLQEMGGTYLGQANNRIAINSAFDGIISDIQSALGYQNITINDGITALSSTGLARGDISSLRYYRSGGENANGSEKYDHTKNDGHGVEWTDAPDAYLLEVKSENGVTKYYKNGTAVSLNSLTDLTEQEYLEKYPIGTRTVIWDINSGGEELLEDGVTYTMIFTMWPSQEAYDLIADLNNGTIKYDDLSQAEKDQIYLGDDNVYYLKTNTKATVDYKSVKLVNGEVSGTPTSGSAPIEDPKGKMNLDTSVMTVRKDFAHLINEVDPYEKIVFYLLVDGKYYNKDGSLSDTLDESKVYAMNLPKDGKWEDTIYIAPGLMRGGEILETGHNYSLEEKIVSGNPYEYEFAPQTVRPMVITAVPTFLVKKDTFNTNQESKKEYTFNDANSSYIEVNGKSDAEGTYYAASENNGSLVGVNHKTSELDITKIISDPQNLMTPAQEASDTFTYRVTLQIPDGCDPSGIVGYEYVPRTQSNAFTLFGYQTGQSAFAEDIERFNGKTYRAWNTLVYDALIQYDRVTENGKTVIKAKRDDDGNIIWNIPAEGGYHTITYDMTLKQDEVIRFTNLPTGTKYKVQEIYANKYPADNVGGKTDGRTPVSDAGNLADEGYEVEIVRHTGGTLSEDKTTVEGIIEAPDTRYYNQFTNKKVTEDKTTRVELKVKKELPVRSKLRSSKESR